MLKNEFVLISLYIDDRRVLEENEKFNFKVKENQLKAINTIGEKWATFQHVNFETASQPYYVTMSPNLELLNAPKQYTGIQPYYQWLQESLDQNAN
ncbi:hypothetical protein [Pareuzebyella sediminis]|uniref:hypothetical protein n=1 Tax=Pareuzebyella sediminis TaxID=2607998 RepID=UPI0011EBFC23|nr:hypothetical protein [Pareuzebyella sediminis]